MMQWTTLTGHTVQNLTSIVLTFELHQASAVEDRKTVAHKSARVGLSNSRASVSSYTCKTRFRRRQQPLLPESTCHVSLLLYLGECKELSRWFSRVSLGLGSKGYSNRITISLVNNIPECWITVVTKVFLFLADTQWVLCMRLPRAPLLHRRKNPVLQ